MGACSPRKVSASMPINSTRLAKVNECWVHPMHKSMYNNNILLRRHCTMSCEAARSALCRTWRVVQQQSLEQQQWVPIGVAFMSKTCRRLASSIMQNVKISCLISLTNCKSCKYHNPHSPSLAHTMHIEKNIGIMGPRSHSHPERLTIYTCMQMCQQHWHNYLWFTL